MTKVNKTKQHDKERTNTMQKTITIVDRKLVQFRRKTARYNKPVGTFSTNQGYLAVARGNKGKFITKTN